MKHTGRVVWKRNSIVPMLTRQKLANDQYGAFPLLRQRTKPPWLLRDLVQSETSPSIFGLYSWYTYMYTQPNAYLGYSSHLVDSIRSSLLQLHILIITIRFLIPDSEWSRPINGRGAHVCSDVVFDFLLLRCRIVQQLQGGWQLFVFVVSSLDNYAVRAAINVKKSTR